MKLNFIKSRSSVKPNLLDNTSSKVVSYIRKNVIEIDGGYEYDEAKLSKFEYQVYLNELKMIEIEKQRADIDYIALMCGIDLEV